MRRPYLVRPTHYLKRCSERACRDRAVRFLALGQRGQTPGLFDIIGRSAGSVLIRLHSLFSSSNIDHRAELG
jgi:hypothetical protein